MSIYIYIFNNIFLYLGIYLFVYVFIYLFISQFLSFFIYIYTYIYIYCLCFKEVVHIWYIYIYTHVSLLSLKHTCISPQAFHLHLPQGLRFHHEGHPPGGLSFDAVLASEGPRGQAAGTHRLVAVAWMRWRWEGPKGACWEDVVDVVDGGDGWGCWRNAGVW